MSNKIGIWAIVFVVLMLVIALGYVAIRSSSGISGFFINTDGSAATHGRVSYVKTPSPKAIQPPGPGFVTELPSGWSLFKDGLWLFEIQYPSKVKAAIVQQTAVYPHKQFGVDAGEFVRGISFTSEDRTKRLPVMHVLVFSSDQQGLDTWIASHKNVKIGYSSQTHKYLPNGEFYKFTDIVPIKTYQRGEVVYRERRGVPQEMWVTVSGYRAYVILFDFGYTGRYTTEPENIVKTFKAY